VAGAGALLFDHEGRTYVDCLSGVGVMNAGHCQPEIIDPVIDQIRTLQHTSTIYLTEPPLRLAERLAAIAPGSLSRSFFCASGSEAVEGALLLARLHTRRPKIIAFEDSLHGRTRFAMNATGLPMWRTDPFPGDDVLHVPFGAVDALRRALRDHSSEVGAVLGEVIQGNGGIIVPGDDWWPQVRALCNRHGALLVFDEVQTGFNRTGRWFACEHWGVAPDVLAMSKGLGNGFPIAAFMTSDEIARSYTLPGASTFGGNPVSAVAALSTIDFHDRSRLGRRATQLGELLLEALGEIAAAEPDLFAAPRGCGLMCGMPVCAAESTEAAHLCDDMLERLKDAGVLAGKTGRNRNVLTFMPPLVVTEGQLATVGDAVREAAAGLRHRG
jgi:acetylornithine/succinyldiaminopimelate/putrescine aminotransferase